MPYTKILVSALVGAVIGYITNWLAIKMLFRPYEEKRVFGMKIPFTPGLIPKEQKRIAKSVGDAVGNHLLTNETLLEALSNNGIDKKLNKWMEGKALAIAKRNITIKEQIKNIVGEKFENIIFKVKNKVSEFVLSTIKKDKFKEALEKKILEEIKKELLKDPKIILESESYVKIRNNILSKTKEYKNSEEFKVNLQKIIERKVSKFNDTDKSLEEVIPEGFVSTIKVYIYSKNYDISMAIKNLLKDEKVKSKLQNALSKMISDNLNPMISMFLNPNTIYDKVSPILDDYLDKEDTQREVVLFINDLIDKVLQTKVNKILEEIPQESKNSNLSILNDLIVNNIIDDTFLDNLILILEDKFKENSTLEEIFSKMSINAENVVRNFVRNKINFIINNKEIEEKIRSYVNYELDKILNKKLCDISKGREEKISNFSLKVSEHLFNKFIANEAIEFIEAFDISKIVEEKINSFEVSFAEKIILEIASKELSAITWFGALLGFVMGLVSSLIATL